MPTNPFMNNYNFKATQDFYLQLVATATNMFGVDIIYIPRNIGNFDKLYEADDQSTYSITIPTVGYLENVDGFQSQQNIFSKFGLEIRDQITLSIPSLTYDQEVKPFTNAPRPGEGDLVYFSLNKKCFQIKFTNNKEIFYPLGVLPSYMLTCELFEYSDETFNTNIPEIDILQKNYSLNILDYTITLPDGRAITDGANNVITQGQYNVQNIDIDADNDILEVDDVGLLDWSANNPFGSIE